MINKLNKLKQMIKKIKNYLLKQFQMFYKSIMNKTNKNGN